MKLIDGDELKDYIDKNSTWAYEMKGGPHYGEHFEFIPKRAIFLDELYKLIDGTKVMSEHDAYILLERERDKYKDDLAKLRNEVNTYYVRKECILDDIKEIIEEDLNPNGLTMTNEQLYDVLKAELDTPLYCR